MAITMRAPQAPTIADLLSRNPVQPVSSAQDEARRVFADRMAAIGSTASLPQALADVGGHIANAIMARKDMARAEESDRLATERAEQRRSQIAEALVPLGYSPEQSVGLATGSPQDNDLVLSLMGLKRQTDADAADRAFRERQFQTTVNRYGVEDDRWNRQFTAERSEAAADRALKEKQLLATALTSDPAGIRTIRGMGLDPQTPEGQDMILRLQGREAAAASIAGTDSGKFREEMAKASVKEIGSLAERVDNKQNQLRLIEQMEAAGPGAFAAPMAEGKLAAAQFARALGLTVEGTTESEMLQSATNQMAMLIRNPESGGGLPGAASDADRRFLVASVPNLSQSPEGRAKLTQAMRAVTEDDIMRAKAKRQYLIDNRGSQDGWEDWAKQNLPPTPDIKAIIGRSGSTVTGPLKTPSGISFEVID